MKAKAFAAAAAATFFALSAYAQHQSGTGSDGVPRSSQSYPAGSTATPSGHSPGQGAGQSGSATADMHRDAPPGAGHGASAGASMSFSKLDRNNDGMISREEWNASHAGSAASGSSTAAPSTGSRASGRGAPEPSSHTPAR